MENKKKLKRILLLFISAFTLCGAAYAQQGTITRRVTDAFGDPAIGVSVLVQGTNNGDITDIDGNYRLTDVASGSVVEFTYIGYHPQQITYTGQSVINVTLIEDSQMLDEVVVIGYGAVKKSDLTGSISVITEKDFNPGIATSAADLLTGKIAGVQITSNGGRAGSGSRIRIRGGASLDASNDPLIVVDGMPIFQGGTLSGASDFLSTINPNDIESMNVLKDASATAIYGSRASNGVIIITTKKGLTKTGDGKRVKVNFSSQNSIATIGKKVDIMNAAEFREAVTNYPLVTQKHIDYLGSANTNWQDEIYRNAFATDNNLSVSGIVGNIPFRISGGFISQNGILERDNMKRGSASINLSPSFFDNHLTVNAQAKGTYTQSFFANDAAIGAALRMDPTQPVKADGYDEFNGYFTWMKGNTGNPETLATSNPVSLLYGKDDEGTALRSIGNAQFDYKLHFLPDLRFNLNLGYDISNGSGDVVFQKWVAEKYSQGGERSKYDQTKQNLMLEFYANYAKEINTSRFDVMAGYTYQDWKTKEKHFDKTNYDGDVVVDPATLTSSTLQSTMISFYGRLNYSLMDKYLITATIRRDGSSRFTKDNRWGTFPSVALAWRASEEGFLKGIDQLSNLKLRLGYGITGQQEGIGEYNHLAVYYLSELTAQYQLGDKFYQGWRPEGYDATRKWEETATTNIGLDYGFFNNRLYGSIDFYHKDTKDLLNEIDLPAFSNFTNKITTNIGSMMNNGVEFEVNVVAIDNKDMNWELGFNFSHNYSKITGLSLNDNTDSGYAGRPTGGISGGTGNNVQMHALNHSPRTFYLYKQLYYEDGTPIEGAFADLNGDGKVNEEDKYYVHKPDPDFYMGFNTNFTYKQWSLGTSLRASIGNYVYNNTFSDLGNFSQVLNPNNFLMNTVRDINNTKFYNRSLMSDYYLENASFLKMDYVKLGYNFGRIANIADLSLNFMVQNVFSITKYEGVDPEIADGIDNNFYPNPRTFSLGVNINF